MILEIGMQNNSQKVLLLSNNSENIKKSIERYGDIVDTLDTKFDKFFIEKNKYDFIVSFGYRFLLDESILNSVKKTSYNLHIGYLPYNRGAHPNFWSNLENTPSGVTIHKIDKGIDTGKILFQKKIPINKKKHSFSSSYKILINEIETLFDNKWCYLRKNIFSGYSQKGEGSHHFKKDLDKYKKLLVNGWDTNINLILENFENKK